MIIHGQRIYIKPNPDLNIWYAARVCGIGSEVTTRYTDSDGKERHFSFWAIGYDEDKQVSEVKP